MILQSSKVIFLDRDGVINEFPGNGRYVTKVKDFHFIPRALEGIKMLNETDILTIAIQGPKSEQLISKIFQHTRPKNTTG